MGHLQDPDARAALDQEQRDHQDFLVLKVQETYENLVLKVCAMHCTIVCGLLSTAKAAVRQRDFCCRCLYCSRIHTAASCTHAALLQPSQNAYAPISQLCVTQEYIFKANANFFMCRSTHFCKMCKPCTTLNSSSRLMQFFSCAGLHIFARCASHAQP